MTKRWALVRLDVNLAQMKTFAAFSILCTMTDATAGKVLTIDNYLTEHHFKTDWPISLIKGQSGLGCCLIDNHTGADAGKNNNYGIAHL